MYLILLTSLPAVIALLSVAVLRRQRQHRQAELAKAVRNERWKTRQQSIPNVSANLCGSTGDAQPALDPRIEYDQFFTSSSCRTKSPARGRAFCRVTRDALPADVDVRRRTLH